MASNPKKPLYYIRMCKDGRWFFVRDMTYNKKAKAMEPCWWPEHLRGESVPYLYKTLTKARNMIDRLDIDAYAAIWDGDNA